MVTTRDVEYDVAGVTMIGRLAVPDGDGRRPAVLIAHEGPGLDDYQKDRASRFAELGYVAFALDYHGGGVALPLEEAMPRLGVLMADPALTRRLGLAGLQVLLSQDVADPDRVAAIGYCFGGMMSLEIGRSGADVKAIVGFHPGLGPPSPDSKNIKGSVLMCIGTEDPFVPVETRLGFEKDMTEAGVADWNLEVYGGIGHSFTNPAANELGMPGIAFDEKADARSWSSMLRLFDETINA